MKMKFYSIWLALILIVIFILQVIFPSFTNLFILNSNSFQQPWRFLTSIFLHSNLGHLLYNLFALVFFGLVAEKLAGSRKFLLVFFLGGIIANIVAINFYSSSLGASGAIFGIIGLVTMLKPFMAVFAFSLPMPMFLASILWAIGDLLGVFYSNESIGYIAHLSGLVVGLIFGIILRLKRRKGYNEEIYNRKIKINEKSIREWESQWMNR